MARSNMDIILSNRSRKNESNLQLIASSRGSPDARKPLPRGISSEDEVVQLLESQPQAEEVRLCLNWLVENQGSQKRFNIKLPSPRASRILRLLTTTILADFWKVSESEAEFGPLRIIFVECLRSIPGIAALILQIRALIDQCRKSTKDFSVQKAEPSLLLCTQEVLCKVLDGFQTVAELLKSLHNYRDQQSEKKALWNQGLSILAGSRLLSTLAQVDETMKELFPLRDSTSLANGHAYVNWLGQNIRHVLLCAPSNLGNEISAITLLFQRSLSLGYTADLINTVFLSSFHGESREAEQELSFFTTLRTNDQQRVLHTILTLVSLEPYRTTRHNLGSGLAAWLRFWHKECQLLPKLLCEWLAGSESSHTDINIVVRQAVVASLPWAKLPDLCDVLLNRFGDKIYIQHSPILQQEIHLENLLLVIGRIYRTDSVIVNQYAKSSLYINAISNRIATSAVRPQILGMILALAISDLVDDPTSRINFKDLLPDQDELVRFTSLSHTTITVGKWDDLRATDNDSTLDVALKPILERNTSEPEKLTKKSQGRAQPVDSSSESELEDDPTLASSNPTKPPVYIRDLLLGLRDADNLERYRVSLLSASDLIRRKASFGTEVSEHVEELATEIVGAKEALNDPKFADYQLQAMVAVILASPELMGRWFSKACFLGDYSVAQRMAILTAISMAARELSGYHSDTKTYKAFEKSNSTEYESKQLPPGLKAFFGNSHSSQDCLEAASVEMRNNLIHPMTTSTGGHLTNPQLLKVRNFSSRLNGEKKNKRTFQNKLSKISSDCFIIPLIDRYRVEIQIRGASSSFTMPMLLAHYLKTLALVLAATGPSILTLPALTKELFDLLLIPRLRVTAQMHLPVLDSLLFCLLALFDANSSRERDLVVSHGGDILEVKSWAEDVLGRVRKGSDETEQVCVLAAGLLVRCAKIIESYQQEVAVRVSEFIGT